MVNMQYSFGPVIVKLDEEDDFKVKCLSGSIACRGYMSGQCFWNGETKPINEDNTTPDWCQYKESAVKDALQMMEEENK
jgi:hypothetical protein